MTAVTSHAHNEGNWSAECLSRSVFILAIRALNGDYPQIPERLVSRQKRTYLHFQWAMRHNNDVICQFADSLTVDEIVKCIFHKYLATHALQLRKIEKRLNAI